MGGGSKEGSEKEKEGKGHDKNEGVRGSDGREGREEGGNTGGKGDGGDDGGFEAEAEEDQEGVDEDARRGLENEWYRAAVDERPGQ